MAWIEHATSPLPRECSATELHGRVVLDYPARRTRAHSLVAVPPSDRPVRPVRPARRPRMAAVGAGEGNRTLVVSLEGFCSTIELHPHSGVRRQRSGNRGGGVSRVGACAPPETSRSGSAGTPPGARCAARETRACLSTVFGLLIPDWWRGKDSNLRRQSRQIYSLLPLTAREPLRETRNSSSR